MVLTEKRSGGTDWSNQAREKWRAVPNMELNHHYHHYQHRLHTKQRSSKQSYPQKY
jgi:hypothetical protein